MRLALAALIALTNAGCALNAYQRGELEAANRSLSGFDQRPAPRAPPAAQPAPQTCTVQPQLGVRPTYSVECQ